MKRTTFFILSLFFIITVSAQKTSKDFFIENLLKKMTLEEKVGQLCQYSGVWKVTGPNKVAINSQSEIEKGHIGSMLNIHGAAITRQIQQHAMNSRLKIPLLFAQDVIHGYKVTFPVPLAGAASWDLEIIEKSERIAATESAASGIHWTFAPMVDICRDARWGRIVEGSGEDPYLGSCIATARVKGFQGNGIGNLDCVAACAKHFAAYGAAEGGRDYNTVDISERTLFETYLPPFKAALDAGVRTFMSSFNDLNGIPSTANHFLLTDLLRKQWKFQGVVVSDWGAISELVPHGLCKDNKNAAQKAINAGCNIDMESNAYNLYLASLVREGKVSESTVDNAVRYVLSLKYDLGLFEDPYRFCNLKREKDMSLLIPQHRKVAKEMAEKSIVLLKNENNLLPLSSQKNIALIGPLVKMKAEMRGAWAFSWNHGDDYVSLFEGMTNRTPKGTNILYAKGCDINSSDTTGFAEAKAIAAKSDIVIMAMGEAFDMTGEAESKTNINLNGVQEELIKEIKATGKPVVVLIMAGRPLIFNWTAEHANSILYTWWLGSEAGNAIANVLYGDYNPSAKLPVTFPLSMGQIPIFYYQKNTGRPVIDPKDIKHKSAYIDSPNTPRYAFGYGLSYTTYKYSNLTLSNNRINPSQTIKATCTVTNTGNREGNEIVQLYIRNLYASVTRPVKELKGFQIINLKAGESKNIEFTIDKQMLSFYNENMKWGIESGTFKVMIGSASDNTPLEAPFEVIE